MGIFLGIVCFAVAVIVLCATLLWFIDASNIIPAHKRRLIDSIEHILRSGIILGVGTILLTIVAFFVFLGTVAIIYLP